MLFSKIALISLFSLSICSCIEIKYSDRTSEPTARTLKEYLGEIYGAILVRSASIENGLLIVTAEEHLDLEQINEQIQRWVGPRAQITTERREDNVWYLWIDQEEIGSSNEAVDIREEPPNVDNILAEQCENHIPRQDVLREQCPGLRTSSDHQQPQQGSAERRVTNANEGIPPDETQPPIHLQDLSHEELLRNAHQLGPNLEVRDTEHGDQNGGQRDPREMEPNEIIEHNEEFEQVHRVGEQWFKSVPQYRNLQRDFSDLINAWNLFLLTICIQINVLFLFVQRLIFLWFYRNYIYPKKPKSNDSHPDNDDNDDGASGSQAKYIKSKTSSRRKGGKE